MPALEDLSEAIGARVRAGRTARGWTLDELAARAGLSRRVVVRIEQGQGSPTVATVLRLADALGVGLPQLLDAESASGLHVVRAGSRPAPWRGEHGGVGRLLLGTPGPDVVELWDWTLQPGESHDSEPHSPGTIEQLLVVVGELAVVVGDERARLGAGDAASFPGDRPHRYAPAGDPVAPARFVLSVWQPGVGGPGERR